MNRNTLAIGLLACLLLQACTSASAPTFELGSQSLPLSSGQALFVNVDNGALDIAGTSSGTLEVSGHGPSADKNVFSVTPRPDGLHVAWKTPRRPFWQPAAPAFDVDLRVPKGTSIVINGFNLAITVDGFDGTVTITTVSGQISVANSRGDFKISSNRGNVTIESSSGQLHVAGNYGVLSLLHSHGELSAATIMGTVRFAGLIAAGDSVSLETDHGPVEVEIADASDVTVQASTTSGVVTCTVPGLHYTGQGCGGSLQAGQGQLKLRTVSGSATLAPLP